jgi:hypothetical protein
MSSKSNEILSANRAHATDSDVFKLLVERLIGKALVLYKDLHQLPLMMDNILMSVVFLNFEKLKPKKKLSTEIYIQIMLLYVMGWIEEYLDEIQDKKEKELALDYLLCKFYVHLVGSKNALDSTTEFVLLLSDVHKFILDDFMSENRKKIIIQIGRSNAAYDKVRLEIDTSLALILNEWMQFKDLK